MRVSCIQATNGDTMLGGEDFDEELLEYLLKDFKKESGIDLANDKLAMQRLREAAEKAKRELDGLAQTDVSLPFITADASGPKHLNVKVSRAQFENMVQKLVDRTIDPCKVSSCTELRESAICYISFLNVRLFLCGFRTVSRMQISANQKSTRLSSSVV